VGKALPKLSPRQGFIEEQISLTDQVCKFCGEKTKLVRAHILPRSLYPKLKNGQPFSVMSKESPIDKRSASGAYDTNLLCAKCDNEFGAYDDVASETFLMQVKRANLLKEVSGLIARGERTKYAGYFILAPRVLELQLFCASLIWRAAHTTREEAAIVVEPSFLARADMLLRTKSSEYFLGIFASRFAETHLTEIVSKGASFSGEYGTGVTFSFSGFNLFVLPEIPPLDAPTLLGNDDGWWIKYESIWGSNIDDALREMISIRQPQERLANG
jgi:hypothetical protein